MEPPCDDEFPLLGDPSQVGATVFRAYLTSRQPGWEATINHDRACPLALFFYHVFGVDVRCRIEELHVIGTDVRVVPAPWQWAFQLLLDRELPTDRDVEPVGADVALRVLDAVLARLQYSTDLDE